MSPAPAVSPGPAEPAATYRVRRGIALTVWPTHTRVLIDGKKPSSAVKLSERRVRQPRDVLRHETGIHRITVLAPGLNPHEIEVVVREDAPVDPQPVAASLTRRLLGPRNS